MKIRWVGILLLAVFLSTPATWAVEVAPRISDREIVERLSRLEEGQKNLQAEMNARFEAVDKRFDAVDKRFDAVDKRFDDMRSEMNARFDALNKRIDDLQWLLNLYISISVIILGFVIRMQWQMNKRQAKMEEALETQKDEIKFLKNLIEKLMQPKGVL